MSIFVTHLNTIQLKAAVEVRIQRGDQAIDILGWMGRTALELIGQGGLGYSFDPLTEDVPNEFGDALKAFLWVGYFICKAFRHSDRFCKACPVLHRVVPVCGQLPEIPRKPFVQAQTA